jgi:nitroreductase
MISEIWVHNHNFNIMKHRLLLFTLIAVSFMAMTSCCNNANPADAVFENIFNRKSVRNYTSEPVSDEHIEAMLKAAMSAPSAVNYQPWRFVVVTERTELDAMAEFLPYARMLKQAPLAIVVCGETTWFEGNENPYWQQDCSAATQNLLLAAEALGLGAVWTGVYPNQDLYPKLHDYLNLPSTVQPFCCIPVGHPAGNEQPKDKWKPENIHYGKW